MGDILHNLLKVTLKHRALGARQIPQGVNRRAEDEQLEEGVQDMENKGDNRGQGYLEGSLNDEGEILNHRGGGGRGWCVGPSYIPFFIAHIEYKANTTFHIWFSLSSRSVHIICGA